MGQPEKCCSAQRCLLGAINASVSFALIKYKSPFACGLALHFFLFTTIVFLTGYAHKDTFNPLRIEERPRPFEGQQNLGRKCRWNCFASSVESFNRETPRQDGRKFWSRCFNMHKIYTRFPIANIRFFQKMFAYMIPSGTGSGIIPTRAKAFRYRQIGKPQYVNPIVFNFIILLWRR